MTSAILLNEIKKYIEDDTYNYAVMIDGSWGCGKSYFVKNQLIPELLGMNSDSPMLNKVCFISLYGVTTSSDFRERLRNELLTARSLSFLPKEKSSRLYELVNSKHGHVVRKLINDIIPIILGDKASSAGKDALNDAYEIFDISDTVFIFDDLERCVCPVNVLFGEINSIVEQDGAKVILISNLNEIRNQIESSGPMYRGFASEGKSLSRYRALSEKLIGITYQYTPKLDETMRTIIESSVSDEDLKNTLLKYVDDFAKTCFFSGHMNLRTFQFFISRARNFYDQFKTLRFGVEEDKQKVLEHTLLLLFVYSIYAKGGEVNKEKAPEPMRNLEDSYSLNAYIFEGDFNLQHYIDEMERFCSEDE